MIIELNQETLLNNAAFYKLTLIEKNTATEIRDQKRKIFLICFKKENMI